MFTIQDLHEGKCAVIHDGTLTDLRKVLKVAFPESSASCTGNCKVYKKSITGWQGLKTTHLPKQSMHLFLKQI